RSQGKCLCPLQDLRRARRLGSSWSFRWCYDAGYRESRRSARAVLSRDYSASVQLVERLLSGRAPGLPRLGFGIVDVRDVADLHIRAMIAPEAAGQRFIAASDFAWLADVAALLRARLGEAANKVPTRKVPDFVLRLAALFDRSLAADFDYAAADWSMSGRHRQGLGGSGRGCYRRGL
ncbi:MAG: hypothetical protein QOJ15_4561, partial [Bradyrhizobium sp.]|nr:hypothetical protein [Bradyrhizobium sp.]